MSTRQNVSCLLTVLILVVLSMADVQGADPTVLLSTYKNAYVTWNLYLNQATQKLELSGVADPSGPRPMGRAFWIEESEMIVSISGNDAPNWRKSIVCFAPKDTNVVPVVPREYYYQDMRQTTEGRTYTLTRLSRPEVMEDYGELGANGEHSDRAKISVMFNGDMPLNAHFSIPYFVPRVHPPYRPGM